jgi:hypothetical protein
MPTMPTTRSAAAANVARAGRRAPAQRSILPPGLLTVTILAHFSMRPEFGHFGGYEVR